MLMSLYRTPVSQRTAKLAAQTSVNVLVYMVGVVLLISTRFNLCIYVIYIQLLEYGNYPGYLQSELSQNHKSRYVPYHPTYNRR